MKRIFSIVVLVGLFVLLGCNHPAELGFEESVGFEESSADDRSHDVGGDEVVLHLPFAYGHASLCTQGTHSEPTHNGRSTKFDLDFDTSNTSNEELFAPVSGKVFVHRDSGFGLHVNIDLEDGTFVTLGHLLEVFVPDGSVVTAGQLLAHEGCTGYCKGDHVHMGRHRGDPSRPAGSGQSIATSYQMVDLNTDEAGIIASEDVVCGIKAQGDAHNGHTYQSLLSVGKWHPNGTLLKTPDDPRVYRLDDGKLRWITHESVFWEYRYDFQDVVLMSSVEQDCYEHAANIESGGMVTAGYHAETGALWLFVGDENHPTRYRMRVQAVAWRTVLTSWGFSQSELEMLPLIDPEDLLFEMYSVREGFVPFRDGTIVSERDRSAVYVISDTIAMPVVDWETYVLMGLHDRTILQVGHDELSEIHQIIGNCDIGVHCIDRERVTTCGGSKRPDIGDRGGQPQTDSESSDDTPRERRPLADYVRPSERQLSVVFAPPADAPPEQQVMFGEGIHWGGETRFPWSRLAARSDAEPIVFTTDALWPGDTFLFTVEMSDTVNTSWACENMGQQGETLVLFGYEQLDVVPMQDLPDRCLLMVEIPEEQEDSEEIVEDVEEEAEEEAHVLIIEYEVPRPIRATRITLSGEYMIGGRDLGMSWRRLEEAHATSTLSYALPDVQSGDTLRFSIEFEDEFGTISWGCMGTPPATQTQGQTRARVGDEPLEIQVVGDPGGNDGCGFFVTVP